VKDLLLDESSNFNARLVFLVPILASLLFGLLCASLLLSPQAPTLTVTPFQESDPAGPFSNALYFVILLAFGATLMYLLLKWKSRKLIGFLIGFAMSAAFFLLSMIYLSILLSGFTDSILLIVILSVTVTVIGDLAIFQFGEQIRNITVLSLGGALGVFLGNAIPFVSALLLLIFLALYDILAVYKGPVGKIANSGIDQLKGLSFSFMDIQMGLGDLVFYSVLTGILLFNFAYPAGFYASIAGLIGILLGSYLTFLILEKKGMSPGLPLPIFIGLSLGLFVGVLLTGSFPSLL
jgi:presenilin-like A22 family membrane protease